MKANILTPHFVRRISQAQNDIDCWLWKPSGKKKPYGQIRVNGKSLLAHRASWQAHFGDIPQGLLVCHRCDTPRCVNPNHLFLGTHKDNMRDCAAKGRGAFQQKGFDFGFTRLRRFRKLTDSQVREIRATLGKESLAVVAERYGVSTGHISYIRNGKRKQLVV